MGQNSIISLFFARRAKKSLCLVRSPLQELEVGQCSGPYLLMTLMTVVTVVTVTAVTVVSVVRVVTKATQKKLNVSSTDNSSNN